jgi:hypothetical protein
MTQFSAADLEEFSELVRLLEAQTPRDVPARDEVIRNATSAWLAERSRVKRITKGR